MGLGTSVPSARKLLTPCHFYGALLEIHFLYLALGARMISTEYLDGVALAHLALSLLELLA